MSTVRTNQELYDFVKTRVLEQGGISLIGTTCAYRAKNGRKCAAGWLMDDTDYDPLMENRSADDNVVTSALLASGVRTDQLELVRDLQQAHDGNVIHKVDTIGLLLYNERDELSDDATFRETWTRRAETVAKAYGLTP